MKINYVFFLLALVNLPNMAAHASDACTQRAIEAHAEVSVSDGSAFEVTTYFRNRNAAAVRFGGEREATVAVEGPYAWATQGSGVKLVSDTNKTFALGHQYHAMILYFDEIFDDIEPVSQITFSGGTYSGRQGTFPHGGKAIIIDGQSPQWPLGMRFELPDAPPIDTYFDDWRNQDNHDLPHVMRIGDGQRQFQYRFTQISIAKMSPLWFQESLPVTDIDELEIYRLHRRLMAAHCLGDADLIADLTAPQTIVANRGNLTRPTREDTRERFRSVFAKVVYDHYVDLVDPVIEVSDDGSIGWVAVNVRTIGTQVADQKPFDLQWAWIMPVKKVNGTWLNGGSASNHRTP